jgi:aspartate kinase
MKIVVLKFGGTSVGKIERINKVANIIISYVKKKYRVIVISSAMGGVTNDLIKKSKKISRDFISSEQDVLVSSGEQISCALIAGRLNHLGYKSQSWQGWQIPIITTGIFGSSRIIKINTKKINNYLISGGIPVIAGFQGINMNNRITTLGRGGSDATAIMIAKFFKAHKCIIYTDVEGVYTTDPKKFNNAKKIKVISYEEMLEMASLGAKVMQPHSIQDAR